MADLVGFSFGNNYYISVKLNVEMADLVGFSLRNNYTSVKLKLNVENSMGQQKLTAFSVHEWAYVT